MNCYISVVIPTYKNRGGLSMCIDSVLNQDESILKEVIVVDDNNPESEFRKNTEAIMSRYCLNPKVKYIKHDRNKNGSAARNTGICAAKGNLIALLDDDDIYLEGKLEKQAKFLEDNPGYDAVCCFELKESGNDVNTKIHRGDATRDILLLQSNFQTSTLVFRDYVLKELEGFDESFIRHQDVELMLRFYQKGFTLGCVPEVLVKMGRNNGENIPSGEKLEELKRYFFSKFDNYIEFEEMKTPGFKNKVYAKHYAGVFLSHIKHLHWRRAIHIFNSYFFKSPRVFIEVLINSVKAHI